MPASRRIGELALLLLGSCASTPPAECHAMTTHASASFKIESWDEKPLAEGVGAPKVTRALVTKSFAGDLVGRSTLEYVLAYGADGSATYVGMERVEGALRGRSGSFVLEHRGTFENGKAESTWNVVHGSGTGDLTGLRGRGGATAGHAERNPWALDYELAAPVTP
jgi:hypothetical protein